MSPARGDTITTKGGSVGQWVGSREIAGMVYEVVCYEGQDFEGACRAFDLWAERVSQAKRPAWGMEVHDVR